MWKISSGTAAAMMMTTTTVPSPPSKIRLSVATCVAVGWATNTSVMKLALFVDDGASSVSLIVRPNADVV